MRKGRNLTTKRTRKRKFPEEIVPVVPWQTLVDLITPHTLDGSAGTHHSMCKL